MQALLSAFTQAQIPYKENEPLKQHTSFKIGGPIAALLFPRNESQLLTALEILAHESQTPLILGNGSNILAADAPIQRVGIKTEGLSHIEQVNAHTLYAECGILLSRAAVFAKELSLSGMEFAHGIPGTLGGAVYMNAGAYNGDMGQIVTAVRYVDEALGIKEISGQEADFSYRHSYFSSTKNIILGAQMSLMPSDAAQIGETMRTLAEKRRNSQPLDMPSAGSTFKRPKDGYAAALIDQCGLKGYTIGGAEVSTKHAGFVVNRGDATCDDVQRLMAHIQETVLCETGISLEPEVKFIR